MKEFRNPQNVHQPLGVYSHHVEVSGERLLILSGQVGMREDGSVPEDQIEQLEVIFENIIRNLEAANMSAKDILKLTSEPTAHPWRQKVLKYRQISLGKKCVKTARYGG